MQKGNQSARGNRNGKSRKHPSRQGSIHHPRLTFHPDLAEAPSFKVTSSDDCTSAGEVVTGWQPLFLFADLWYAIDRLAAVYVDDSVRNLFFDLA